MEELEDALGGENQTKMGIIDYNNNINQLTDLIAENEEILQNLESENANLARENDELEKKIYSAKMSLDEIQQKLELNTMLKDIDINELKMLSQNNAVVNNSIKTLIGKWDKVYGKLTEIEEKEKNENKAA